MTQPRNYEYEGIQFLSRWLTRIGKRFLHLADRLDFMLYRMEFGERDDDIYIVTYPKSGTTLMQMILYQLTTNGDMTFNHIYEVSPWIRNASFRKEKPKSYPSPRLIKSHEFYTDFPKGTKGRFIFVYRDGMDVALSLYHQNKNYNAPDLTFERSIEKFLGEGKKSWFHFTKQWLDNKNQLPILYLRYEDLMTDKEREIGKIIRFCRLQPGQEQIERAVTRSSFEYMKQHEEKFGLQPPVPRILDQFIRRGKIGEGEKQFSSGQKERYLALYQSLVKPAETSVYAGRANE